MRTREQQNVFDDLAQAINPLDHRHDDFPFAQIPWQTGFENLQRPAQTCQRIPHFVRDDRRELPQLRQGLLFPAEAPQPPFVA